METFGQLFEALATLTVRAAGQAAEAKCYHLRTRDGELPETILESQIEVKSTARPSKRKICGLFAKNANKYCRIWVVLLSFTVENYKGFATRSTLSMSDAVLERRRTPPKGDSWAEHTQCVAGIFGSNASGKTTFLEALALLIRSIREAHRSPSELHQPNRLFPELNPQPTCYELEAVLDDVRWRYQVAVDSTGVQEETLTRWRKSRPVKLIERSGSKGIVAGVPDLLLEKIGVNPDVLFINLARMFKSEAVMEFVEGLARFLFIWPDEVEKIARHTWLTNVLLGDRSWVKLAVETLKLADLGISGISVDEHQVPAKYIEIANAISKILREGSEPGEAGEIGELPEEELEQIAKSIVLQHVTPADGETVNFNLTDESRGTIAWLNTAIPAIYGLKKGAVVVCDELDESLHPALVRELVEIFKNETINTKGAQLIFNTHDVTLLDRYPDSALAPHETWFTEKNASEGCVLYQIDKGIRKESNLAKQYFQGAFGSVPNINTADLYEVLADG
ncbi:ATP/GTP-binding protein [uncultured Mobiluncus sp.]|uniref:AAA family ATPase n=1 Tax=uncultured Mobiluncus sp. TaxID=293425 RepID=UPI00261BD94D|nr:ATP-binding protein [uncultured Mobiluncus sp.]